MNQLPLAQLAELAMLVMMRLQEAAPVEEGRPPLDTLVRELTPREIAGLTWSHHARQPVWAQHWQTIRSLVQPGDTFWLYRNPADRSTGVVLLRGAGIVEWIPLSTW